MLSQIFYFLLEAGAGWATVRQSLKDKFSNFLSVTQNFCVTICLFCIMKHINESYYGRIIPQLFCYKRGPYAKNSKKVLPNQFNCI